MLLSAILIWVLIEGFRPVQEEVVHTQESSAVHLRERTTDTVASKTTSLPSDVVDKNIAPVPIPRTKKFTEEETEEEQQQDAEDSSEDDSSADTGTDSEEDAVTEPNTPKPSPSLTSTVATNKADLERRMELAQRELRRRTDKNNPAKYMNAAVRVIEEGDELAACCPEDMQDGEICVCDQSVDLVVVRNNGTTPDDRGDVVLKQATDVTQDDEPVANAEEVARAVAEVRRQAEAGWLERAKEEEARALAAEIARRQEIAAFQEEAHVRYMREKHEAIKKKQLDRQMEQVNGFLEELDTRVEGRLHKLRKEYAKMEIMRREWKEEVKALYDAAKGEGPADTQLRAKMERAIAKAEREARAKKADELAGQWENWEARRSVASGAGDTVDAQRSGLFGGKGGWRWVAKAGDGDGGNGHWQFIDGRAPDPRRLQRQQRRKERDERELREKLAPQHSHMIRVEETWHVAKPGTGRYGTGSSVRDQVAVEEAAAEEARTREQANKVHIMPCTAELMKTLPSAAERLCARGHVRPLPEKLDHTVSDSLKKRKKSLDPDVQSLV